jgi:nucleoside-diphosphate-sugar epimerase
MPDALIGHTGFVGGILERAHPFEGTYNSANIESIRGASYDLVVCAGAPAEKWRANQDPEADLANLSRLMRCLEEVEADHLVLVSTVDVYPMPRGVDEDTPIDSEGGTPYGRHRLMLERLCAGLFDSTVVRLPALFGPGLKKNAIFDLINDNRVHLINPGSTFQFYNLSNLWADIGRIREAGLRLVNIATEPLSMRDVAREAFGLDFENPAAPPPAHYDFRSLHAERLGGRDGYLYDRGQVMADLADFVRVERGRRDARAGGAC